MPKAVQYKTHSVIYFEGDSDERIFILQRGIINLTSSDIETGAAICESIREGEFFGVKSAIGHFPREETAVVMTDSVIITMNIAEFERLAGGNSKIMMKMLKVFSNQLRGIHKKIQTSLDSKDDIKPEDGILSVAEAFYNDEDYVAACDVYRRYLSIFKDGKYRDKAARLYEEAKKRITQSSPEEKTTAVLYQTEQPLNAALKPFSLPGFSRFAKTYKRGTVIFSEFEPGECFYLIQAGRVHLIKCVNGCKKNLDILLPSEFFGEMAILENSPRSATAIALDTVELLEFNKANFELLIINNPQIAMVLLRLFCKRIYDQKRRFKILAIPDKQARVGDVLLMLDETQPSISHTEGMRRFDINIQEIAHWAGLPPETVTDEIDRFVAKRKFEFFDNYIVVNNMLELKRFVESRRSR